ncbi:MAG: spermidine synthase-like protein [Thermodesulfobacteriota bacterium]
MRPAAHPPAALCLAIGLLSCGLIACQLALMQLLALVQWHHFAYLIIAVALLGFGAAGTLLALLAPARRQRLPELMPTLLLATAAAMALLVPASHLVLGRFDAYEILVDPGQILLLGALQLLFFVPFFLGALPIGIAFASHTQGIGTLYLANLLGSGLGGPAAILALGLVAPQRLPVLLAVLPLAGGLCLGGWPPSRRRLAAALLAMVLLAVAWTGPWTPRLSAYKDLSHARQLPEAVVRARQPSPQGLVERLAAPALRHAPGLSLHYRGEVAARDGIFVNGDWWGAVPPWPPEASGPLLDQTPAVLPYRLAPRPQVLVLHAGSGEAVGQALVHGGRVIAVEPHRTAVAVARSSASPYDDPGVALHVIEPRTFLARDQGRYDLITLPAVGGFGSSGLLALQEQYLLTREGFDALWAHLTPGGVLQVTAWLDFPARASLRLAATVAELLERQGVGDPRSHLAVVRSWASITFLVARSPLPGEEVGRLGEACQALGFDLFLAPGRAPEAGSRFHQLENEQFLKDLRDLLGPDRERVLADYPFDIRPARDDRPFFFQLLSWQSLPLLARLFGERALPLVEMGYAVVLVTVVQLAVAAAILVLLPLARRRGAGSLRLWTLRHFGGIGVAYMFVEIALIHELVLAFGQAMEAAAAAIGILLVASGSGSFVSDRLAASRRAAGRAAAAAGLAVALLALLLPATVRATIAWPLGVKALAVVLAISPAAFAMGFCFPLGMRVLDQEGGGRVAWGWSINGCASVASAALAVVVAVEWGFRAVLLAAVAAYGLAAWGPAVDTRRVFW